MCVQRMLEMSMCLYTGRNFKQNIGKKIDIKLMTLFPIMTCQFHDSMPTFFLADILYDHCPHDRRVCTRKILMDKEMKYFQKYAFLLFFNTFLSEFGSHQGHYMCLLNIRFALFVAKNI